MMMTKITKNRMLTAIAPAFLALTTKDLRATRNAGSVGLRPPKERRRSQRNLRRRRSQRNLRRRRSQRKRRSQRRTQRRRPELHLNRPPRSLERWPQSTWPRFGLNLSKSKMLAPGSRRPPSPGQDLPNKLPPFSPRTSKRKWRAWPTELRRRFRKFRLPRRSLARFAMQSSSPQC